MVPLFIKSITAAQPKTYTPTVKVKEPAEDKPKSIDIPEPGAPSMKNFEHLLALISDRNPGGDFGPHNVDSGHHVAFAAGSFTGSGKVTATGRDGLTVEDSTRREHRVHWREVTGHFVPEKAESEKNANGKTPKAKSKNAK